MDSDNALGIFEIFRFEDHRIWWARRRYDLAQEWPDTDLCAGRTDTDHQALGLISKIMLELSVEQLADGSGHADLGDVLAYVRRRGEKPSHEGEAVWSAFKANLGEAGLADLEFQGRIFLDAIKRHGGRLSTVKERALHRERQARYRARQKRKGHRRVELDIPPDLWERLVPILEQIPCGLSHPGYGIVQLLEMGFRQEPKVNAESSRQRRKTGVANHVQPAVQPGIQPAEAAETHG